MILKEDLEKLKLDLSVKSKNGLNFTLAASIVWLPVSYIWTLHGPAYDKSILTFIIGSILLPLAFLFSKLFKIAWSNNDNALQSLGLWLNFAQLFYFPFLIFTLIKMPDYFIMVYAIITGGHLFPYAWFYKTNWYAIFAGFITVGALLFGLILPKEKIYIIPIFMSGLLLLLTVLLYFDSRYKQKTDK